MKVKIRSAFSGSVRSFHPIVEDKPHKTQGEFKKECDINNIVKRWKDGVQPPSWMTSKTPRYGDFSDMPVSFMEAFDIMARAEDAFNSLPLAMRHELDHDPRNLDKAPRELFERFGLLKKPVSQTDGNPSDEKPVGQGSGDSRSPKPPKGGNKAPASGANDNEA